MKSFNSPFPPSKQYLHSPSSQSCISYPSKSPSGSHHELWSHIPKLKAQIWGQVQIPALPLNLCQEILLYRSNQLVQGNKQNKDLHMAVLPALFYPYFVALYLTANNLDSCPSESSHCCQVISHQCCTPFSNSEVFPFKSFCHQMTFVPRSAVPHALKCSAFKNLHPCLKPLSL